MSKSDNPLADRETCSECGTVIRTALGQFPDPPECYSCQSDQTPEDWEPDPQRVGDN